MTATPTPAEVDELLSRHSARDVADMLNAEGRFTPMGKLWTKSNLCKYRSRWVPRDPASQSRTTEEAVEQRIKVLASEGMPARYIAADVGMSHASVSKIVKDTPDHEQNVKEWNRVWASFRLKDHLYALHQEFHGRRLSS